MTYARPKCQVQGCANTMERGNTIMCHMHYQTLTGGLKAHINEARADCRAAGIKHSEALRQAQQDALRWARDHQTRQALKATAAQPDEQY